MPVIEGQRLKTHHWNERRWHNLYHCAKARCQNPAHKNWSRYGGRGIKFLLTLEQMSHLWIRDKGWNLKSPSIDRVDNDGNYTFQNCRFIEMDDNRRKGTVENNPTKDPNVCRKIALSRYGKVASAETRGRMSEAHKLTSPRRKRNARGEFL